MLSCARTPSSAVCSSAGTKTRHSAKSLPVPSKGTANVTTKTGPINPNTLCISYLYSFCAQKFRDFFSQTTLADTSTFQNPGKSTGGGLTDSAQSFGEAAKLKSPWEISCRLWRWLQGSLAEVGMMTCTQPIQLEIWLEICTEHARWPVACQLLTFNKLARIRKVRLGL